MTSLEERANQLTVQLKSEFGVMQSWTTNSTLESLKQGTTDWEITLEYNKMFQRYREYQVLVRVVLKRYREEIGECSIITVNQMGQWIDRYEHNEKELKQKYQQQYNIAQAQERKAKKLLAEIRRDYGECDT